MSQSRNTALLRWSGVQSIPEVPHPDLTVCQTHQACVQLQWENSAASWVAPASGRACECQSKTAGEVGDQAFKVVHK